MSPFQQQQKFMEACGQTTDRLNMAQAMMYRTLIREEVFEFQRGVADLIFMSDLGAEAERMVEPMIEVIDGALDSMVVLIGFLLSLNVDVEAAWQEVILTNLAKIDPSTGLVRKRDDGKVLKPEGWTPPNLRPFAERALGLTQGEKHDPV